MFSPEFNPGLGRSGRVRPNLETLEDRCCPSTVSLNASTHLLTLTGDASSATVVVRDNGHGDMTVYGLAGATAAHPRLYTGVTGVAVNLGTGNDQVTLDFTKGVSGPKLNVSVQGGLGNQDVTALFGTITNTNLQLAAHLGNGLEHFTAQFNGPLMGTAKVDLNVQGGTLSDGVNIQDNGAIAAGAKLSVETTMIGGTDTVHVGYAGKLAGALSVEEKGGAGWDWQQTAIGLTGGSTGSVLAHEQGGTGADLFILTVADTGSRLKSLSATVITGTGTHAVSVTSNVHVTI